MGIRQWLPWSYRTSRQKAQLYSHLGCRDCMTQHLHSWIGARCQVCHLAISSLSPQILIFSICGFCHQGKEWRGDWFSPSMWPWVHVLPDLLGSRPATFHSLSGDARLPGWWMTSKRTGNRHLLRRVVCSGLQMAGYEGMVLFLIMVSSLAALLLKQVRQKFPKMSGR